MHTDRRYYEDGAIGYYSSIRGKWYSEDKIFRFIMLEVRRRQTTSRRLSTFLFLKFRLNIKDRELRGIIKKMMAKGMPIVSTDSGFTLATPEAIQEMAARLIRHGASEIVRARKLAGSRLWHRLAKQYKLKME